MIAINQDNIKLAQQMADTLRILCADMIENANSGHPGVAMGLADIAVVLSTHLTLDPTKTDWINRDRLVFSGGHASSLVYALLHLWGFDVSLQDLKSFRQLGSKTPGHPEMGHTPGVEITTGPLGQGIANAVGLAMASKYAKNIFADAISHHIYCLCGDGDLQEGISYEACSLAGHHALDNLILIYDCNHISIEGNTNIVISEDISLRFKAQNWEVLECDGHDFLDINQALHDAKKSNKPVLIIAKTKIGKKAAEIEGSEKTHGAPLGERILKATKSALGFDPDAMFVIPDAIKQAFGLLATRGLEARKKWESTHTQNIQKIEAFCKPDLSAIVYPSFKKGEKIATRTSNGQILNAASKVIGGLIGGSADLGPSNNTTLKDSKDFPNGKNLHFGIREHAMGAISNAFASYGLFLPFCATFFVFSDYLSPSIRIASLMQAKVFYIFTHDSIGVGEDGATHQPIEQLSHFRAMPNLTVFRPADANENIACFKIALSLQSPSMFVLSRQNLEVLSDMPNEDARFGAYILKEASTLPKITLLASGSEVALALKSAQNLENDGIPTQVVSAPSFDLLLKQDKNYHNNLFKDSKVLAIEAARSFEWYKFAHNVIMMEGFGSSGKGDELFSHFGFSVQNICARAKALL